MDWNASDCAARVGEEVGRENASWVEDIAWPRRMSRDLSFENMDESQFIAGDSGGGGGTATTRKESARFGDDSRALTLPYHLLNTVLT